MKQFSVRHALSSDVDSMVSLFYQKRRAYENVQPQFWKYAGAEAEIAQSKWFNGLLEKSDHIILVAEKSLKYSVL